MKPRPRAKNTSPRNAPSRFSKFLFARFCAAFFFFFFFFFSFDTLKRVKVLSLLSFRQSRVVVLMGENDNFILSIFDSFFVSRKKQIKMKKRILRERKKERKKDTNQNPPT